MNNKKTSGTDPLKEAFRRSYGFCPNIHALAQQIRDGQAEQLPDRHPKEGYSVYAVSLRDGVKVPVLYNEKKRRLNDQKGVAGITFQRAGN